MPLPRSLLVAVLALTGVTASGCASDDPAPSGSAPTGSASGSAPRPAVEAQPVPLPGGDAFTWRFAVAPDGQRALVGRSSGFFPTSRQSRVDEVRLQPDGSWGEATQVSFSTDASADLDPFLTDDGSRVWFSSIRPVDGAARTDTDLWYADRRPHGTFDEPVNPGPGVNGPGEDLYPTVGPDGTLYFGSDRGGNGFDIWRVPTLPGGGWGTAEALPAPVTTEAWEFNPALAPDGRTLVFTALDRSGGQGLGDLWFTVPDGTGWSEPEPLAVVNSARDEYHASFSPDGTTMFFVRGGVLHQVAVDALGLPAGGES